MEEKELSRALKDLQRYQTKEVRTKKDTPATKDHKVVVDMNMKKEHVPIEGGQGKNHAIYLNESYYIPGLIDQVIGMKEGVLNQNAESNPSEIVSSVVTKNKTQYVRELTRLVDKDVIRHFYPVLQYPGIGARRYMSIYLRKIN